MSNYKYVAKWRAANRAKERELDRRYKRLRRNATFRMVWPFILAIYGGRCVACQREGKICIDHVVPLTMGGANHLENIQPLCRRCNGRKIGKAIDHRPDKGRMIADVLERYGWNGDMDAVSLVRSRAHLV